MIYLRLDEPEMILITNYAFNRLTVKKAYKNDASKCVTIFFDNLFKN